MLSCTSRLFFTATLTLAFLSTARADAPAPEQAVSTETFLDSIGLNPSLPNTTGPRAAAVKARILELGVRHVRSGLDNANILDLAKSGIQTMVVVGMPYGPNDPATGKPLGAPYNGSQKDIDTIRDTIKKINTESGGKAIDSVEASNEPDLFWNTWYNQTYGGEGYPQGSNHFLRDLYTTLKADLATAKLTVIGTAIGKTPAPGNNPQGDKTLAEFVDWGNGHPYPGKGSTFTYGTTYDTIPAPANNSGQGGYEWNGTEPSNNMDANPYFFQTLGAPYIPKPMACTETGYFTGISSGAVSETVLAKYVPRLFAEYFRLGVKRTFWYNFVDDNTRDASNSESTRGLLHTDLTPKPAYTALKSLLALLRDDPKTHTAAAPARLAYTLAVQPVLHYTEPNSGVTSNYDRVQYAHHLLTQKRDGAFCLLLWHEISDSAPVDKDGKPLAAQREILPPSLPATLTLPATIKHVTLYTYDATWHLVPKPLTPDAKHQVTLSIADTVAVVALTP